MTKVVSLDKRRAAKRREAGRKSLCREGHHKWQVVKEKKFDVKRGRLVTVFRCARCGEEKVEAL